MVQLAWKWPTNQLSSWRKYRRELNLPTPTWFCWIPLKDHLTFQIIVRSGPQANISHVTSGPMMLSWFACFVLDWLFYNNWQDIILLYNIIKGRVQKKKYGNFHKRGGVKPVPHFFFCILNSSRNALKKFFLGGGYPQKKNPKGPPFGYFGNFFKISKYIPIIEKSQGSPLWIFWKNFQNFKKKFQ